MVQVSDSFVMVEARPEAIRLEPLHVADGLQGSVGRAPVDDHDAVVRPGVAGEALERHYFGAVRPDAASAPSRRRYPVIALKLPGLWRRVPGLLHSLYGESHTWWQSVVSHDALADVEAELRAGGREVLRISAATGEGIPELIGLMLRSLDEARRSDETDCDQAQRSHDARPEAP